MSYVNLPDNLRDMYYNLSDRISKLETIGQGNTLIEPVNLAGAFSGSKNINLLSYPVWFYNTNATGNGTLNFRGNSSVALNDIIQVGTSVTCAVIITNGSTGYYPTAFTVDGSSFTKIVWIDGAPSSGNANSEDAYVFTITKLSTTPTWHCRANRVTYA